MPAVRIESEAFSDERYVTLARLAGLADADHARGKMARLWRQCTDHCTPVLPVEIVESVLGPNASEAITKSLLGEAVHDGIRICGTEGRIEWCKKARKNGRKGGLAKAKHSLSKSLGNVELEIESSSPSERAADNLRKAVLTKQPNNKTAKTWTSATRKKWAESLDLLNRIDGREWVDIDLAIHWLFYEQSGDYQFVVLSPDSLREKWDRIDARRKAKRKPPVQASIRLESDDAPDLTYSLLNAAEAKT